MTAVIVIAVVFLLGLWFSLAMAWAAKDDDYYE
jgi:hypothetical protein